MLHARKGPYESTMNRDPIIIRRVPNALAFQLAAELDKKIPLKPIYFARMKEGGNWKVEDIKDDLGNIIGFKKSCFKICTIKCIKSFNCRCF